MSSFSCSVWAGTSQSLFPRADCHPVISSSCRLCLLALPSNSSVKMPSELVPCLPVPSWFVPSTWWQEWAWHGPSPSPPAWPAGSLAHSLHMWCALLPWTWPCTQDIPAHDRLSQRLLLTLLSLCHRSSKVFLIPDCSCMISLLGTEFPLEELFPN